MELIKIENEIAILDPLVSEKVADFERKIKLLKEEEDKLKEAILKEMEENQIIKLDTPELLISYVASTDRETFDSKTFKADHQDLYDEYVKMSPVKSSIRIKVK